MPFVNSNDLIAGRINPVTPAGPENITMRSTVALPVGDLAINIIGQIGILPAGCLPVQLMVDASDMDSGVAAMVLQVGILDATGAAFSTAAADGGAAWGLTAASTDAFQQQILSRPMAVVTRTDVDRKIGVRVAAAPTAAVAGVLGLTLIYRAA